MDPKEIVGIVERDLDRTSPVPLYFQVAKALERAIEQGDIAAGTLLENEIDFARSIGVSRPTMRRAMDYLVEQGFVVRRRGIGTTVVQPKVRRPLELTSLFEDLSRGERKPTTEVLEFEVIVPDPDVAAILGLSTADEVTKISRLRSADATPIAVLTNYIPTRTITFDRDRLETSGLYQLMRQAGVTLYSAHQTIGARIATTTESKLLGERRNAAVLTMERTAYDDHGTAVEFGTHVYAASRYSFELSMVAR